MKNIFLIGICLLFWSCSHTTDLIRIKTEQPVLPVLTEKTYNPVLKIQLIRKNSTVCQLQTLSFSLEGTSDIGDIENICLYEAGEKGLPDEKKPIGQAVPAVGKITCPVHLTLETDTTTYWVTCKLKNNIDLSHRIHLSCLEAVSDQGKIIPDNLPVFSKGLRVGVAVRRHLQDGVYSSRIPGLATSPKGTLLAIYDARYESARDLQGDIDICMNRSTDGGRTWTPMQVVLDRKEWGGLPEKYNGISDANILVDEQTGDIYVAGLWMHGVLDGQTGKWVKGLIQDSTRWIHQWHAKGSQPGVGVKETSQFLITKSSDDGLTWSEPVNITAATKRKEWWLFAPAPGHGITLTDGTLVFPTQGRDEKGRSFSNITWSKDKGKTWTTSNPAFLDVTECMVIERSDGSLMLNMRDNRNRGNKTENGRRICTTNDLGQTWNEHPTSRKALIEPTCMASLHKHLYKQDGEKKSILLFCNPESYSKRDHLTLKVSFDEGNSWPDESKILLDQYSSRGYSCITSVDENTIGILYESSQADLVFQQIKLNEILK